MDNFERLIALAEFGANRHNERRQVEFRIFISYTTLLALILYHATASGGLFGLLPNMWDNRNWLPTIPLLTVHWVYCLWQRSLSVAMASDAKRRNFFLAKAECIAHYFIKYPHRKNFRPSQNRKVRVVFRDENSVSERSETELFEAPHPDILILPLPLKDWLKHWDKTWRDWSRRLQFAIPTIMLGTLFLIKLDFWWLGLLTLLPLALLSLILPFISFFLRKKERNDN